jgi:hypothetical protein
MNLNEGRSYIMSEMWQIYDLGKEYAVMFKVRQIYCMGFAYTTNPRRTRGMVEKQSWSVKNDRII